MRGLRFGEASDVRICLVVIWKKRGVLWRDSSGSDNRGSFFVSDFDFFSGAFLRCFISAFNAFVNFSSVFHSHFTRTSTCSLSRSAIQLAVK